MSLTVTNPQTHDVTGVSHRKDIASSLADQLVGKQSHAAIKFLGREFFIAVTCMRVLGDKHFEIEGRINVEFVDENEEKLPQPTGFTATLHFTADDPEDHIPYLADDMKPVTGQITVFPISD